MVSISKRASDYPNLKSPIFLFFFGSFVFLFVVCEHIFLLSGSGKSQDPGIDFS